MPETINLPCDCCGLLFNRHSLIPVFIGIRKEKKYFCLTDFETLKEIENRYCDAMHAEVDRWLKGVR